MIISGIVVCLFTCLMYPTIMTMFQGILGENSCELIGLICMMGSVLQYIFMWFVGKSGAIANFINNAKGQKDEFKLPCLLFGDV